MSDSRFTRPDLISSHSFTPKAEHGTACGPVGTDERKLARMFEQASRRRARARIAEAHQIPVSQKAYLKIHVTRTHI
jgi:hypothetical protein